MNVFIALKGTHFLFLLDYLEPKPVGPLNQRNENHEGHMFLN